MLPSSLTYCTPSLCAALDRISSALSDRPGSRDGGRAHCRRARPSRRARWHSPLRRDDQRVDLGQRGVLLDHTHTGPSSASATRSRTSLGAARGAISTACSRGEAGQRVHVAADQVSRGALGHLFDVHAALTRTSRVLFGRAVEEHRGVVLARDVGSALHPTACERCGRGYPCRGSLRRARAPATASPASFTPPALPRPPLSTCALITTG